MCSGVTVLSGATGRPGDAVTSTPSPPPAGRLPHQTDPEVGRRALGLDSMLSHVQETAKEFSAGFTPPHALWRVPSRAVVQRQLPGHVLPQLPPTCPAALRPGAPL